MAGKSARSPAEAEIEIQEPKIENSKGARDLDPSRLDRRSRRKVCAHAQTKGIHPQKNASFHFILN